MIKCAIKKWFVIVNYLTDRIKVQIACFSQLLLKWNKSILIVIRAYTIQHGY